MTSKLEEIPCFTPTELEFENIVEYLSDFKILKKGLKYGMIKIIPPDSFLKNLKNSLGESPDFKFNVRKQDLSTLNLLNRCRLSFVKQLESFNLLRGDTTVQKSLLPYKTIEQTDIGDFKVYLYDIMIEIIKYYNYTTIKQQGRKRLFDGLGDSNSELLRIPSPSESFLKDKNHSFWYQLSQQLLRNSTTNKRAIKKNTILHVATSINTIYNESLQKYLKFLYKYRNILETRNGIFKSNDLSILQHDPKSYTHYGLCGICDVEFEEDDEDVEKCLYCKLNYHQQCTLSLQENKQKRSHFVCENCLFGNGCYGFEESDETMTLKEFQDKCDGSGTNSEQPTHKDIEELESQFWGKVNNIDSKWNVIYGADIHNESPGTVSGFENQGDVVLQKHPMNLLNLPQAKGSLLNNLQKTISGMTIPWIYIGSKFSTFCWHLEDQYTMSCNYQFEGDSKIWYSIPPSDGDAFNELIKKITPDYLMWKHPDLLHQLITLISPYDDILQKSKINIYKAVQNKGEFIITYPKCYHAGFNTGYNFNEAVNFTINPWIPFGLQAVEDYKKSGKKCVFDMWALILKILEIFTSEDSAEEKSRLTLDSYLITTCYLELLKHFNRLKTNYDAIHESLNDTGYLLAMKAFSPEIDYTIEEKEDFEKDIEKDYVEEEVEDDIEEEPICASCKTICSFVFVITQKNHQRQKTVFKSIGQVLHECDPNDEECDFEILCLDHYLDKLDVQEVQKRGNRPLDDRKFSTVYFTKTFTSIENTLKKTERLLQKT